MIFIYERKNIINAHKGGYLEGWALISWLLVQASSAKISPGEIKFPQNLKKCLLIREIKFPRKLVPAKISDIKVSNSHPNLIVANG